MFFYLSLMFLSLFFMILPTSSCFIQKTTSTNPIKLVPVNRPKVPPFVREKKMMLKF